jgi:mono/diheme cytochrome c family protein
VLSALATSHKVGIAAVAAVFIVFALVCSFVLPRWRPDFPGRRVGLFVVITVLLTAAMLGSVIALAGEPKEERTAAAETTTAGAPATTTAPAAAEGDAAAGKALFAAQGCNSCHTFTPAGASGKVGPDLDNLASDAAKANRGSVQQYVAESIEDPNAYVVPGFPKGVMPPFALTDAQVADLVAFLGT